MTMQSATAASGPAHWIAQGMGAVLVAATSIVFAISFAAIVYSGPLETHLDQGIGLTLLGAALMAAVGPFLSSYRGTICQPQDVTALLLSIAAASIAAGWTGAGGDALFATVASLTMMASVLTGLAAWLMGRFRLGFVARFVPYPVLGGFLAATGYLLTMGAIGMTLGRNVSIGDAAALLAPGALALWLPWVLAGAAMVALTRRFAHPLVLPGCILAVGAGFYLFLAAAGMSLADAREAGLLMGPFEGASFLGRIDPAFPASADWSVVLAQAPTLAAVVGMALLGTLLNATGLELTLGRDLDMERELQTVAVANIAASAGGGVTGFHLLGETIFANRLGIVSALAGLSAAAGCTAALLFGAELLSRLPVGLFAAVIAFLGLDMLYGWLWVERRKLPAQDFAIVLLILGVAAAVGFLEALAIGLVAAALLFIVAYAGVDVVRLRSTAADRRSLVERAPAELARLDAEGAHVPVWELSGFLFFGTANVLITRLRAELSPAGLILDFHRVRGIDVSAVFALVRLAGDCAARGTPLTLTGLAPDLEARFRRQAGAIPLDILPDLDAALLRLEETILAAHDAALAGDEVLAALRAGAPERDPETLFEAQDLAPGETLIAQGSDARALYLLRSGTLRAEVTPPGGSPQVVARFAPGALVGEIAAYAALPRTASVIAETEARVLRIDRAALDADPELRALGAGIDRLIATHLARRLARTTRLLAQAGV